MDLGWLPEILCLCIGIFVGMFYRDWAIEQYQKELEEMNEHYPPGTFELPGEKEQLQTYVFEIGGEIEVEAYSEEEAEQLIRQKFKQYIDEAFSNGDVEYR